jgi:hypothetical protein
MQDITLFCCSSVCATHQTQPQPTLLFLNENNFFVFLCLFGYLKRSECFHFLQIRLVARDEHVHSSRHYVCHCGFLCCRCSVEQSRTKRAPLLELVSPLICARKRTDDEKSTNAIRTQRNEKRNHLDRFSEPHIVSQNRSEILAPSLIKKANTIGLVRPAFSREKKKKKKEQKKNLSFVASAAGTAKMRVEPSSTIFSSTRSSPSTSFSSVCFKPRARNLRGGEIKSRSCSDSSSRLSDLGESTISTICDLWEGGVKICSAWLTPAKENLEGDLFCWTINMLRNPLIKS